MNAVNCAAPAVVGCLYCCRALTGILQEKARSRNPDEFYFKMVNASSKVRTRRGEGDGTHTRVCFVCVDWLTD